MSESTEPKTNADRSASLWCFFGALGCLAVTAWLAFECYAPLASSSWPVAEATVKESKVFANYRIGETEPRSYEIELRYEFSIGGQTYTGSRYNGRSNKVNPENMTVLQGLKTGSRIAVHYSPSSPSVCIVDTTVDSNVWVKLGFGVLSLLGTAFFGYAAFSKPKPTVPPTTAASAP
jgi:hypothetical protein